MHRPEGVTESELWGRLQQQQPAWHLHTQREGAVEVAVAIPDREQTQVLFGAPLWDRGIQPVWIRIRNEGDVPYWFFPAAVDANYFPPLELVYQFQHDYLSPWADALRRSELPQYLPAGTERSGFIFTNLAIGTKPITVTLVGPGHPPRFEFDVSVPGVQLDYQSVDFQSLHQPETIVHLEDEEALRKALQRLPCCTSSADGTRQGDPLNVVILGRWERLIATLVRSGWDETEASTQGAMWRASMAFVSQRRYRHTLFSPLYVFGRHQDLGLQKSRQTISVRNHLRLWMTPLRFRETPVWVGTISRDVGVRLTLRTWPPVTHTIDPNLDEARTYLLEDLILNQGVEAVGFVEGVGVSPKSEPNRNLTGDPYFTDGVRVVLILAEHPMPPASARLLRWRWPAVFEQDFNDWLQQHPP